LVLTVLRKIIIKILLISLSMPLVWKRRKRWKRRGGDVVILDEY